MSSSRVRRCWMTHTRRPARELLELRRSTLFDIDSDAAAAGRQRRQRLGPALRAVPGRRLDPADRPRRAVHRPLPARRAGGRGVGRHRRHRTHPAVAAAAGRPRAAGGRPADLEPVVHDPAFIHNLLDVQPDRLVYATNRRNGVDFDIVSRTLATGAEQVLWDGGGWFSDARVSAGRPLGGAVPADPAAGVLGAAAGRGRHRPGRADHRRRGARGLVERPVAAGLQRAAGLLRRRRGVRLAAAFRAGRPALVDGAGRPRTATCSAGRPRTAAGWRWCAPATAPTS